MHGDMEAKSAKEVKKTSNKHIPKGTNSTHIQKSSLPFQQYDWIVAYGNTMTETACKRSLRGESPADASNRASLEPLTFCLKLYFNTIRTSVDCGG